MAYPKAHKRTNHQNIRLPHHHYMELFQISGNAHLPELLWFFSLVINHWENISENPKLGRPLAQSCWENCFNKISSFIPLHLSMLKTTSSQRHSRENLQSSKMLSLGRRKNKYEKIPPHKLETNLPALQQRRSSHQGPSYNEQIFGS